MKLASYKNVKLLGYSLDGKLMGVPVNNSLSLGDHIENGAEQSNSYSFLLSRTKLQMYNKNYLFIVTVNDSIMDF